MVLIHSYNPRFPRFVPQASHDAMQPIGVRDGGSGGAVDPPIRADIRHLFGQKTRHLFD